MSWQSDQMSSSVSVWHRPSFLHSSISSHCPLVPHLGGLLVRYYQGPQNCWARLCIKHTSNRAPAYQLDATIYDGRTCIANGRCPYLKGFQPMEWRVHQPADQWVAWRRKQYQKRRAHNGRISANTRTTSSRSNHWSCAQLHSIRTCSLTAEQAMSVLLLRPSLFPID